MTQEQGRMKDYTGRISDEISDDVSKEPVSYTLGDTNYEQSDENKSSDAIKADIEQTRSEMSQKINQIQDRLDPTRLKEQAQETVRSAVTDSTDAIVGFVRSNAGDFGYTVVDTIKRNPVPAALIGIGLGWMIFKSFSSSSSEWQDNDDYTYGERYNGGRSMGSGSAQYSRQYGTDYGDQSRYSYEEGGQSLSGQYQGGQYQGGSRYGGAQSSGYSAQSSYGSGYSSGSSGQEEQGRVSQVVQSAQEKASDVLGQARDTAGQLTEQVQETAQQAGQYVQEKVGQVREQAQQTLQGTGSQVQRTVENNPVPFGVAALVAGVLVGLALPSTQAENQIMGEKRDQLIDNAQSVAQDVKERVQSVVEEKLPEVKQTAQKVADDLKQTGKTAAEDIKQTLKEAGDSTKQSVSDVAQASKDAAQDATQSAANKMSTTTSGSASYTGSTTVGSTTTGSTTRTSSLTGGSTESSSAPEEEGSTKNSRM